ncbi:hypothetical protein B0H15DRAFT_801524 [Mycena belliarum]|uniref:Uncharacterized protein n=1 Tax=Mycena belliarum TaxID=1033014 RepID=A0AAD6U1L0_9AGAR|nr:hypothetical protein B0H15DRAFT_801524 [Mycena belliae]
MTEMLKRQQELREIQAEHNRDLDEKAAVDYRRSLVVWREERALQVAKHNDLEDRRADQVQAYNAAVTEMAEDTVSFVNTVGEYALFLLDQQRGGGGVGESATPPPAQPDTTISAVDGEESEEESPPPVFGRAYPAPPPPRRRRLSDATAVSGGSGDGGDDQEGEGDGEGEEEDEDEDGGSEGEPEVSGDEGSDGDEERRKRRKGKQRAAGSSGKAPARRRHRGPHVSVPPCFSHIRNPTMLEGFYDHDFHDLEPLNEVAPFDPRKKPRPDKKHPRPDHRRFSRLAQPRLGSMGVLVVFTRGAGCRLCKEHHWACLRVRTGLQMEAHCIRCRALKRTCVPHTRHTSTATPGVEFEPFDWTYSDQVIIQVNKHYFELYIRMFVDVMERQTRLNMREVLLGMALASTHGRGRPR